MKTVIRDTLRKIEAEENVRILHAVESGSRAWGFPSPDSDYDVRFIYVRPVDFYLRLDKTRDVIEWQLDDTLDVNGWDLSKVLTLLHKSNPTLFEWNASPIVYETTDEWQALAGLIQRYFTAKSGLYHYLNTAKHNYREFFRGETAKLKKYFYVLRPILACRWILAENTPPPMLFHTLKDRYLDPAVVPAVDALLEKKMSTSELGEAPRIAEIDAYIEASFAELDAAILALPEEPPHAWDELNAAFRSLVR